MKIAVMNAFHQRTCTIVADSLPHDVTEAQARKIADLCGTPDCMCSEHVVKDAETGKRLACAPGAGVDGRWRIEDPAA